MYSLLIDTYIKDTAEKQKLFNGIEEIPAIKRKAEWALKYKDSTDNFATRLIAFACVEGIHFSASFCSIYWLKQRGLMPGLTFSNEFISRDEGLHTRFACLLYKLLIKNKLSSKEVQDIVTDAVLVEKKFVVEALQVSLVGMNAGLMCEYVEYCADNLLDMLEQQKYYHAVNPFPWMEMISLEGKTNFFERRVSEYSRPIEARTELTFNLDEDF